MDSKQRLISRVKSPAKDAHLREGKGFSLEEITSAGKSVGLLKTLKINIDFFRKSSHPGNIEKLKSLKVEKKKKKKKKPFVKKEKRRTPFKSKMEKTKEKEVKVIDKFITKIPIEAAEQKVIKKEKIKVAKIKKEKIAKVKKEKVAKAKKEKAVKAKEVKETMKGTPLTELSGLGAATVKKFADLGVNNIEDLCKENPEELAPLIKSVSVDKLKKWIEEANNFLK